MTEPRRARDVKAGDTIVDAHGRRWGVTRVQTWRGCATVRLHLASDGETRTAEDNTGRPCYAVECEPAGLFD